MTARLRNTLILALFCLLAPLEPAAAADDRTAGGVPGRNAAPPPESEEEKQDAEAIKPQKAETPAAAKEEAPAAPAEKEQKTEKQSAEAESSPALPAPDAESADVPHFRADYRRLESLGTLNTPQEGSLGIDIWYGTERPMAEWLVTNIPNRTGYRVINNLVRKVLLTSTDSDMLGQQGQIEPGQDLLTLRLEKLIEMGAFGEAAQLYALNPNDPYHERLGRAGIMAMLYNGQTALGCLETKALQGRFGAAPFWQQLTGVCDYLMAHMGGDEDAIKAAAKAAEATGIDSPMILKAMDKPNWRYDFKSAENFQKLRPLEKAFLTAANRVDYSGLKKINLSALSPHMAALMRNDTNVPASLRFKLWRHAVRTGMRSTADLAAFYKGVTFPKNVSYDSLKGWERLAWLYQAADVIKTGTINEPVQKALALGKEYGTYSLLPFATQIRKTEASAFDGESIRQGLEILTLNGEPIPADWSERWKNIKTDSRRDFLLHTAYIISGNLSTIISANLAAIMAEINTFPPEKAQLLREIYAKLDKSGQFVQDAPLGTYEKQLDLTLSSDYVMPSMGLKESFFAAREDRRVAETVLLSSLVLHGTPPDSLYPELLRETVKGLETVGLTKDTRELAVEVILGLK